MRIRLEFLCSAGAMQCLCKKSCEKLSRVELGFVVGLPNPCERPFLARGVPVSCAESTSGMSSSEDANESPPYARAHSPTCNVMRYHRR